MLRVFRHQFFKYLNNIGVISINTIIRAVDHVLYDVLQGTQYVTESHDIKFEIYYMMSDISLLTHVNTLIQITVQLLLEPPCALHLFDLKNA